MVRTVVFDPTERELFDDQRQRFDWTLLQSGFVFRYAARFQFDSACTRLTDLGYLVHELHAQEWTCVEDMHTAFAASMSFPDYYGRNLDALDDVLSDVATFSYGSDPATAGTVLAIADFDVLLQIDYRTGRKILEIFARQARLAALYGHPMLCLVETNCVGSRDRWRHRRLLRHSMGHTFGPAGSLRRSRRSRIRIPDLRHAG
jgi:hypothetical protein